MNWLCVVFLVLCTASLINGEYKCCKTNHFFEKSNGTFKCSDLPSNKSHIFTNNTDFLGNNSDGHCVEYFDNFYIFNINNSEISQFTVVDETVFSKCCPLNFTYNIYTHACEPTKDKDHLYIRHNFVKIGLPKCEVIVDQILENIKEDFFNNNNINYNCLDRSNNGSFVLRKCEVTKPCSQLRCIQKCCPDGQSYIDVNRTLKCVEGYQGINLTEIALRGGVESPEDTSVTVITNNFTNIFLLNETYYPTYLNRKGIFSYSFKSSPTINRTSGNYCVEYTKNPVEGYFFFLSPDTSKQSGYDYYSYIQLISSILLALTIIIYVVLNEIEKLFGKILVNYCLAVLIWYAQLSYLYIGKPQGGCLQAAFVVIFARTAAFVWSNVMCWDIWRTFGSTSGYNDTFRKNKNHKKIIIYFLYGWGLPTILTLIILLFYTYKILPHAIQPYIAQSSCFFDTVAGNYSQLLFLDIPTILLQVFNIILFTKTTIYCLKVKNEINKMNDNLDKKDNFNRNKAKLYLILKLLLIMGVTFVSEAITTSIDMNGPITKHMDRFFNIVNAAQGIFIFIIFIWNQQILNNIKKKCGMSNLTCTSSTDSVHTQSSNVSCDNENVTTRK